MKTEKYLERYRNEKINKYAPYVPNRKKKTEHTKWSRTVDNSVDGLIQVVHVQPFVVNSYPSCNCRASYGVRGLFPISDASGSPTERANFWGPLVSPSIHVTTDLIVSISYECLFFCSAWSYSVRNLGCPHSMSDL